MPIMLAELMNEQRKFTATLGRDSYWIVYKPHEMTPQVEADFMAALSERSADGYEYSGDYHDLPMLQMFAAIVVDWEVEGPLLAKFDVPDFDNPNDETAFIHKAGDVIIPEGEHVFPTIDNLAHLSSNLIGNSFQEIQKDLTGDPKAKQRNSRGGSLRRAR